MLPLIDSTIGMALKDMTKKYPARPAIEYRDSVLTYLELDKTTDTLAAGFLAMGIGRGTHVGVWSELDRDLLLTYYALQKIGAVTVMFSPVLSAERICEQLRRTDCQWLMVGRFYSQVDIAPVCEVMKEKIVRMTFDTVVGSLNLRAVQDAGAAMSEAALSAAMAQVVPEDPSMILFTSGTSSSPKAVVSTHYSRMNSGVQQAGDLHASCEDRFCVMLPMFHCFSISTNLLAALAVGACLVLSQDRHSGTVLRLIDERKCTILNAVPTAYHAMISRPDFDRYDLRALRTGIIGGGTYTPEQFVQFERKFGMTLLSSLGQTECTAGLTVSRMDDPLEIRSTTVGHFMDHVEYKIVDLQTGMSLPADAVGEICVRGYLVMKEYYADPERTAETIDAEGWCHTGDLGRVDEQGNVHLSGRIKELVIRAGENISPKEVADVLLADPRIADAKVIGVKDEHYGEELCACVVPAVGAKLDGEAVRTIVRGCLEAYKVPAHVLFFEQLPYNTTGKVILDALRKMVAERGLTT